MPSTDWTKVALLAGGAVAAGALLWYLTKEGAEGAPTDDGSPYSLEDTVKKLQWTAAEAKRCDALNKKQVKQLYESSKSGGKFDFGEVLARVEVPNDDPRLIISVQQYEASDPRIGSLLQELTLQTTPAPTGQEPTRQQAVEALSTICEKIEQAHKFMNGLDPAAKAKVRPSVAMNAMSLWMSQSIQGQYGFTDKQIADQVREQRLEKEFAKVEELVQSFMETVTPQ